MVRRGGSSRSGRGRSRRTRRRRRHSGDLGFFASVGGAVIAAALILLWLFLKPVSGEEQGAVCLLLVDRTGSSTDERTEESYKNLARRTVQGCRAHNSSLALYYFDNTSAKLVSASTQQPFQLYRPATQRESLGEAEVRKAHRRAEAAVEAVFDSETTRGGHGSDIVTALHLAAQNLQQLAARDHVQRKYLVVLTDGHQTGEELGLKRAFTQDMTTDESIERVAALGLDPQLDGVRTSFAGVSGGLASANASLAQEAYLRKFWEALVTAGGGQLCLYGLEPMLLPGEC